MKCSAPGCERPPTVAVLHYRFCRLHAVQFVQAAAAADIHPTVRELGGSVSAEPPPAPGGGPPRE